MIHRLDTNKLRNVAKFCAHLLGTYALPWHVLSYIRLTEEDKILFQVLRIKIKYFSCFFMHLHTISRSLFDLALWICLIFFFRSYLRLTMAFEMYQCDMVI